MTTLNRTLIIGLGGTGVEVLRKFKRRFVDLYDREQKYMKLLAFDTAEQLDSLDPRLSPSEFLLLSDPRINVAEVVNSRHENPSLGWIKGDLPQFEIIAGAGQKRLYGHLAYFWRGRDIYAAISRALDGLFSAQLNQEFADMQADCRIFVVSSLCGGTGTGMFLDISYLVQNMIEKRRQPASYFGLMFLPSAFQALTSDPFAWRAINANGYAALEELNYYMQDKFECREFYSPLPDEPRITVSRTPFDMCYLLGGSDSQGHGLESSAELYERTAEFIAANATLPEIRNAVVQYLATNTAKRSYASFGSYSMVLPYARYVERYLFSMGDEVLVDLLQSETEGNMPSVASVFDRNSEYKAVCDIAEKGVDAATSGRVQREVKVHTEPDDHPEASRYIEQEHALAVKLRDTLSSDASTRAKNFESELRKEIVAAVSELWTVRRGAINAAIAIMSSILGRCDELQRALSQVTNSGGGAIEDTFRKHRVEPHMIDRLFKTTNPAKRLADYRADMEQALLQELKSILAREFGACIGRVKADVDQMRRGIVELRDKCDVIRAEYKQVATEFVGEHHKGTAASTQIAGEFPESAGSEYKDDRLALLNKCRADLTPNALLGSLERPRVDLRRFIQELYRIVSKYIFENKSRSQLFEHDRLGRGIREAAVNVHLKSNPNSEVRNVNWLFVPPDARLREQVDQVFENTRGGGHNAPQVFPSIDENVLTYLQFKVNFELKELADIETMQQAYESRLRENRVYLQLDTHQRRSIRETAGDARPKELLAFGLMLGVIRETGQNLKLLGGKYLLPGDVSDKVERRREAYKALTDPDNARLIDNARRKAEDVGNDQLAEQIETYLSAKYSDLNAEDPYEVLLLEEKKALDNYITNLGVRRRGTTSTN